MIHTETNTDPLIGQFRRFGAFGPAYEILGLAGEDGQKGPLLKVRVLDTGEDVEYPYKSALDDPEA